MIRSGEDHGMVLVDVKIFGENTEPVVIKLDKGLNLVGGASNTGKSYLYQLIDSLLGKKRLPKEIVEADSYDQAVIQISRESDTDTIVRDLKTGDFYHTKKELVERADLEKLTPLSKQHNSSDSGKKGVSNILLEIMDCNYSKVKKNKRGDLVSFSYRHFAHQNMIDEDHIYTDTPYFLAGSSKVTDTQQKEALLTSLSGMDDLSLAQSNKFFSSEKISGQLSEIERQINKNRDLLALNEQSQKYTFEDLDTRIFECKTIITNYRSQISSYERQRSNAYERYTKITKDLNYSTEIINRIRLLEENYESDLKRIEFIGQADYYLDQLDSYPCPICGEETENINGDLGSLIEIEQGKLHSKLEGLSDTLNKAEVAISRKKEEQKNAQNEIDKINYQIEKEIQPVLSNAISDMETFISARAELAGYRYLTIQLKELESRQQILKNNKNKAEIEKGNTEIKLDEISLERLCKIVEELLQEWGLFGNVKVEFDLKSYDLVVNNKHKGSYGKGFKSLINSAYVIANFLYTHEKGLAYPGFVMIDSPLIVYSPKYKEENDLSLEVTDLFYKSINERFKDYQIIIFENKLPSKNVLDIPNFIEFTGTEGIGRYGLFPIQFKK